MDISRLRSSLQVFIPEELYDIEPGQIVFFVPYERTTPKSATVLYDFFRFIKKLHKGIDVNLSIVPTDNELLIDNFACRNPKEILSPYKVAVGPWETFVGIASEYYGVDRMAILGKVVHMGVTIRDSIIEDHPVIVYLDPDNHPGTSRQQGNQSDFDLGMKIAIPEKGSLAEKKLKVKEEKKLEKILRECAVLGIDLEIDRIKKKVEEDLKKQIDYQLILKTEKVNLSSGASSNRYNPYRLGVCDIYVADREDCKLDFTALQTAIYLSFLLYEDGVGVADSYDGLRQIALKIYSCLPDVEKTRKSNTFLDDSNALYSYMNSLRGYFTHIREEIMHKVPDPFIAQKFCIEGFNNAPFKIEMSSPEIRAQIKETFGL